MRKTCLVQTCLQIPKRPAPVHGLRVLATVQTSRRLSATDSGGRTFEALPHGGAQSACDTFEFLGTDPKVGSWKGGRGGSHGGRDGVQWGGQVGGLWIAIGGQEQCGDNKSSMEGMGR